MDRSIALALTGLATAHAFAQFSATITVSDAGSSMPLENATVVVDGNAQTTDVLGQTTFTGLVDGTYEYTVSATCFLGGSGSVTIDDADGSSALELAPASTNNVFFFIGSPLALIGATVQLTDGADYNMSFVTWDTFGGEMLADVPFGTYTYTISKPCYETVTGTVTVDCNNGDGIAVIAEPQEANNVFFFIGSPLALIGATVQLTDGAEYNESFVTWDTFGGEMLADVPFGTYTYTISKPCYETVTGTVTVDCNNGDGIAVVAEPAEIIIDTTVDLEGSVLTAAAAGMSYQWLDCGNNNEPIADATGQSFEPAVSGTYAVTITSGDCSATSGCTAVVITSIPTAQSDGGFRVHPNPFNEQIMVHTGEMAGAVRLQLFNADGRLVVDETRTGMERIAMNTSALPCGTYALRMSSSTGNRTLTLVK